MNKFCSAANDGSYTGSELEIFAAASNWKAYYKQIIRQYIGHKVLEVGAGLGATTAALCDGKGHWVCLEPDARLARRITDSIASGKLPACCRAVVGTIRDVPATERFDTILYIDVLEHIEDDLSEVQLVSQRLKNGGFLVVLAPAHQDLYTPFDAKIGHYRRYNKRTLSALMPSNLAQRSLLYVDSVGGIASLANRYLLHSDMPTASQIEFWDKKMIPLSRRIDRLLGFRIGKSIIGVWQRIGDE
jgi:2-polyprenyl-3-methyl-5-hydroxy-6-metoxy-1,4-benzoquinol methylase